MLARWLLTLVASLIVVALTLGVSLNAAVSGGSTWSDRARVPRGVIVGVGGRVDLVGLARPPLVFSPLFLSKMRLPFVLSSSCFKFREN